MKNPKKEKIEIVYENGYEKMIIKIAKWIWSETVLKIDPKKEEIEIGYVWLAVCCFRIYPTIREGIGPQWGLALFFFLIVYFYRLRIHQRKRKLNDDIVILERGERLSK